MPTQPPTTFPLRLAVVDVGSNAIRYAVAEFSDPDHYTEIEAERIAVRLGRDVFTRERTLSEITLELGTAALVQIRRRLDDLGIPHYRAVATSAVRESRNGGEFVDRVRRESGIHLETISGSEEARLVWLAIRRRVRMGSSRWVLMDLGGGSVEISVVDRDGILWSESHTLGSVRLLQRFQEEEMTDEDDFRTLLERYVQVLKMPRAVAKWSPVGIIATGGNIEALAKLADAPQDSDGVRTLPMEDLRATLDRLVGLTEQERIDRLGLRVDRADVIVPAAVVYERVAELAGANEILVPGVGVREGVLMDLVDDLTDHSAHAGRSERGIYAAAVALGRRFRFDEAHARQVAELSLSLFDQLHELHDLGARARRILMTGALLHDIGQFISYRRHHKHSWYIISNADLPELSPRELEMAALVARYHRRAEPNPSHPGFDALDEEEQELVTKVSSLLRVADALDREHVARVQALSAEVAGDTLILRLDARGDLALESWALRKKGRLFERVFGLSIRVRHAREID